MPSFSVSTTIDAPVPAVWAALDDIGSIHLWNPGVVASNTTSEAGSGIGASRHCDLKGRSFLKETVVEHEPERVLTMRITETNLPMFETADIRFMLEAQGERTKVAVAPDYRLKGGPIGRMLDALAVRRTYRRGMEALLDGLRRHVEG